jgi:hypothetical protein
MLKESPSTERAEAKPAEPKRPGKKLQFDRNEAKRLHRQHPKWKAAMVAAKITDAAGNHPRTAWVYQHWN